MTSSKTMNVNEALSYLEDLCQSEETGEGQGNSIFSVSVCIQRHKLNAIPATSGGNHILYPNFMGFPCIYCFAPCRPKYGIIDSSILIVCSVRKLFKQ